jgi:hypothetical protein
MECYMYVCTLSGSAGMLLYVLHNLLYVIMGCFLPTLLILKKINVGLCYLHAVCFFCDSPYYILNASTNVYMELDMHITASEPISTAYIINLSH